MELFFLFNLADGEEERCVGRKIEGSGVDGGELDGFLLWTFGELFDAVVNNVDGFVVEVDEVERVFHCKARDEGDVCGTVAFALQLAGVSALLERTFFVDEVDVVDGEDIFGHGSRRPERGALMDGVPQVELRQERGEESINFVCYQIVYIISESAHKVLGDQERDVESIGKGAGVEGIPAAIVERNLTKAAHGLAELAEVYEYALPGHESLGFSDMRSMFSVKCLVLSGEHLKKFLQRYEFFLKWEASGFFFVFLQVEKQNYYEDRIRRKTGVSEQQRVGKL